MAMAWISLGGSHPTRFGFLIVFLLLNVCALGQRVVGVQPGERLADAYFFLEDSSATYFVSTFGNRAHDIKYVRGMSMRNGKHFAHVWNEQSHYLGVEVVQGNLELFYYSMSEALDSLLLWNTTMDSVSGWSAPRLVFSTGYSNKNRTPQLQCKLRGQTLVVFSENVLYASKELMHWVFVKEEGDWRVKHQMNWKVDRWGDYNQVERWAIDGSGNAIVLTGKNRQMQPKEDNTIWTQNVLYYFDIRQTKLKQWDLVLGDRVLREAIFRESPLGLQCLSLYSHAGNEKIAGLVRYDLDTAACEVTQQSLIPFDYPNVGSKEWILKGFLPTPDGFWLYGEDYYFRELVRNNDRWTTMSPGIVQYLEYYMEIYLLRFNTNGTCEEVLVLPKAQEVSMDEQGPSFVCYRKGEGIGVQYNDHNYNTPLQQEQRNWVGSKTVVRQLEWKEGAWKVADLDREEWKKGLKMNLRWWPIASSDGRYQVWVGGNSLVICEERKE
jgi:hypothetical protein